LLLLFVNLTTQFSFYKEIAGKLKNGGISSIRERHLYLLFRDFADTVRKQVFVSKYLINLPGENELTNIIEQEQSELNVT